MDKVVDGVDDGQTCTYIGFEEVFHSALAGYLLQLAVVLVFRRGGYLVGRHYRYVVLQQVLVERGDACAGRTVDKHRVEDVHTDYLVAQHAQRAVHALLLELFAVVLQIDAFAAEQGFRGIGDAHHVQLEAVLLHQFLALAVDLLDEASAYRADAADEEVEHLVFGKEERVVDDVERFAERLAFDHERDVRLRGTLCTGYHVDSVAP